ncbi:MAG: hypothetical protein HON90_02435 [Halobacteriovoraceae bacterium]|jgi:hypothetical protein|nr:hypothetical protein [Halobacteriovoraceae bacterium]
MKTDTTQLSQRYMILIKIDAINLFNRIKIRQHEYIEAFSLKRDRDIFKEVFKCRYDTATIFDLSHLPHEVIEVMNDFYTEVDELSWYLMNTQDMPNAIEDEIIHFVHQIEKKLTALVLYIDAELSGANIDELKKATTGVEVEFDNGFDQVVDENLDNLEFSLQNDIADDS